MIIANSTNRHKNLTGLNELPSLQMCNFMRIVISPRLTITPNKVYQLNSLKTNSKLILYVHSQNNGLTQSVNFVSCGCNNNEKALWYPGGAVELEVTTASAGLRSSKYLWHNILPYLAESARQTADSLACDVDNALPQIINEYQSHEHCGLMRQGCCLLRLGSSVSAVWLQRSSNTRRWRSAPAAPRACPAPTGLCPSLSTAFSVSFAHLHIQSTTQWLCYLIEVLSFESCTDVPYVIPLVMAYQYHTRLVWGVISFIVLCRHPVESFPAALR